MYNTSHCIFCFTSSLLIIRFLVPVGSQCKETEKKNTWLRAGLSDRNFNLLRSIFAQLFKRSNVQIFKLVGYLWTSCILCTRRGRYESKMPAAQMGMATVVSTIPVYGLNIISYGSVLNMRQKGHVGLSIQQHISPRTLCFAATNGTAISYTTTPELQPTAWRPRGCFMFLPFMFLSPGLAPYWMVPGTCET